jgi:4-hydroxy-2-oxoheptanedioate aldolase
VAPYVETVEQAQAVAAAAHYRPIKGKVLADMLAGDRKPSPKTTAFLERFNQHNYAIIGVESVPGYENLDALIKVEGVDGVFIGPHDVTVSMETPEEYDNPAFLRLLEDVIRRCRAAGVGVGVHVSPIAFASEQVRRFMDLGMNWILDGADVVWAAQAMQSRREELGVGPPPEATDPSPMRSEHG